MKQYKTAMILIWPHIVILLLLAAWLIVSLVSLAKIGNKMEALYYGSYVASSAADTANETFEGMQSSIFHAILNESQDMTDEAVTKVKDGMELIEEQVSLIEPDTLEDISIISRLKNDVADLAPMQEHVLELLVQKKKAEAAEYMESNSIPVIKEAQKELAQLVQSAEAKETRLMASLRRTQRNAIILLICLGVVSVLFSAGIGTYILRLQHIYAIPNYKG